MKSWARHQRPTLDSTCRTRYPTRQQCRPVFSLVARTFATTQRIRYCKHVRKDWAPSADGGGGRRGRLHGLYRAANPNVGHPNLREPIRCMLGPCMASTAAVLTTTQASSWTTSVFLNAQIAYGRFTGSLGEPYQSSLTSARSEIDAFVRTATNYSIPAEVTMADEVRCHGTTCM